MARCPLQLQFYFEGFEWSSSFCILDNLTLMKRVRACDFSPRSPPPGGTLHPNIPLPVSAWRLSHQPATPDSVCEHVGGGCCHPVYEMMLHTASLSRGDVSLNPESTFKSAYMQCQVSEDWGLLMTDATSYCI